jgi:hypothetical protein
MPAMPSTASATEESIAEPDGSAEQPAVADDTVSV